LPFAAILLPEVFKREGEKKFLQIVGALLRECDEISYFLIQFV
jgi:hypothetical protein